MRDVVVVLSLFVLVQAYLYLLVPLTVRRTIRNAARAALEPYDPVRDELNEADTAYLRERVTALGAAVLEFASDFADEPTGVFAPIPSKRVERLPSVRDPRRLYRVFRAIERWNYGSPSNASRSSDVRGKGAYLMTWKLLRPVI